MSEYIPDENADIPVTFRIDFNQNRLVFKLKIEFSLIPKKIKIEASDADIEDKIWTIV